MRSWLLPAVLSCRSLSMATPPSGPRIVRFGSFELDRAAGELRKSGLRVRLQEQPFRILDALLAAPGEIVTRDALRQRLWPDETFVDFDNGLNRAINRLRAALGDEADSPRFVETVDRRGYRFIAPVEASTEPTPEDSPAKPRAKGRRGGALFVAGAALAAAGALAAWGVSRARERGAHPAGPIRSLAVLPLADLSADPGQAYYAEGMTDALITNLASLPEVRVISRQSVMRYRGSQTPLPQIARELDVDALLEGSVLRSGDRVRITVQFIHGTTDRHLWAGSYERPVADVLAIHAEIAAAVRAEVQQHVVSGAAPRSWRRSAVDPRAYDLYLQGGFNAARLNPASLERAVETFQQALALDPTFAPAHAGLGQARLLQEFWGDRLRTEEHKRQVREAIDGALRLDPDLALAHDTRGRILLHYDWDFAGAEAAFRRAIELEPSSASAHNGYSLLLQSLVRLEEALVESRTAAALDPGSAWVISEEGRSFFRARRYAEAEERYQRALALEPGFGPALDRLVQLYLAQGRLADARQALDRLDQIPSHRPRATIRLRARLLAAEGDAAGARRLAAETTDAWAVHVALGDHDRAFEEIERSVARKSILPYTWTNPEMDPLRGDPRFARLARAVGLPVEELAALRGPPPVAASPAR